MVESKYYFDNGLSWHVACAGDEVKSLRTLEKLFGVHLVARENWVQISGEEDAVARASAFFDELSHFYQIRRKQLETRDFEFLCRSFRDRSEGDIRELMKERIDVSPKKREVLPRSRRQLEYVRAIRRLDVVFGIGPAGTGKTYLAMALAVSEFLKGNVSRIVLTRPARESGENLGFLPGSLEEKIMPYLRPLYDALYDMMSFDEVSALIERGVIEVAPLAFMRGRTLNNAFIILDEAQNTTVEQMLMFLTRMGFNSRCVITGDPSQSDLTGRERSGLLHAIDTLRSVEEIGFVFFDTRDVVRHALLEKIILAYNGTEQES
ncbi:MAG TPA: phosphate starvation-inducible protein PhoH [Lentisphaeria bacterium]|uniref:PhoH family protein n=1 Tax=uncultured Victivallis sp. TaxID=354118 RepID=UPI000E84B337|nr:PhoH family protein [uncultured Victivallis sp.]MBS5529594.1 PhoH family protein [bacterium]HBP07037.1 phosphate starvation-inducible protein PhoH [Lentisphaeria bacterium]HCH84474.1 phosphate starvation-inducible protein PhoH [Lentisphaeria bacterium]